MFYYFGYGSNLSVIALQAKGVCPLRSEPAMLEGWRLTFNVPDFFPVEGGTGNIEPSPEDAVHGVLHMCRRSDLMVLDRLEALGITYDRRALPVTTYSGRRRLAFVYVGINSILSDNLRPSERYRNILVRGAVEMKLDPSYVDGLLAVPCLPRPSPAPFAPGPLSRVFSLESLAKQRSCVALAGYVFDMTTARAEHAYLRELLGGKDVTLFFLKRLDTSDGKETFDDVWQGRLTQAQRDCLNIYLHEFSREYVLVGRMDYDADVPGSRSNLFGAEQPSSRQRRSSSSTSRPPSSLGIAARLVLDRAEASRDALGHENLGFLSESAGFMPREAPRQMLPPAYAAWDQAAASLPFLYRTLRLRRELDNLPLLDADPASLPDGCLLRAAAVLAMLAHAYWYVETHPPERLPAAIAGPWREVRDRLGRGPAVLTYIDLIVYNFRMVDPRHPDPMRVENLRLLIPTVDTNEERTFYLTQTEILARCSPIVGAVVRAQEAVLEDDPEALESELITINSCLQSVVRDSLLKINPNPNGATHVDPVVWAKTVAPFAVPMQGGVQGPSGTTSPIFNTLDTFFGRERYATFLGKEIHQLRATYPPLWREFITALSEISVPAYVERTRSANLKGLLREAVTTYAGPNGFLGRHRMKVYGYLELAFKVGRSVTIGGFKGVFKDRTWDQVDLELEKSRQERTQTFPLSCHHVLVKSVTPKDPTSSSQVSQVVLDISGTGLYYEVGDRCGILPENSPELTERTLAALGAMGEERVRLTPEWRDAIRLRHGYDERSTTLSLREVLRFGRIRPVLPRVAEALHAMSQNDVLKEHILRRSTHHWELWDLLEMLRRAGFDPRQLWQRHEGDLSDSICSIVPPENFRMYSISSAMTSATTGTQQELHLTVGRLQYESRAAGTATIVSRSGTASSFLASAAERKVPVSVMIEHPPRFGLPKSARAPIIMLAGGTGLSPFRGFLAERMRHPGSGESWLFLGLRSRDEFTVFEQELASAVECGVLKLWVAFSRENVELQFVTENGEGRFVTAPGRRRYIEQILAEDDTARALWEMLLRPNHDGAGTHIFVCGRSGFARSAMEALKGLLWRFAAGTPEQREIAAERMLAELMAEGRLMEEIFSGHTDDPDLAAIDVSELVRHNDDKNGSWIAIEGNVYDVTEFIRLHPGGSRVLQGYCGMDGTEGYDRTHAGHSEIDAMRQMYLIGTLRRLDLAGISGVVRGPSGDQHVSLAAAHGAWVKLCYLVVEMQNALRNDHSLQESVTARGDPVRPRSLYKLQKAVETHERFLRSYLDVLLTDSFENLWAITQGLFAPDDDREWMRHRITGIEESYPCRHTEAMIPELFETIRRIAAGSDADQLGRVTAACELFEAEDAALLAALKLTLIRGITVFEELGRDTRAVGSVRLAQACRDLPAMVEQYFEDLFTKLTEEDWRPAVSVRSPSRVTPVPGMRSLLAGRHYIMEEDEARRVVVLRRTPVPFTSIDEVVAVNEQVIGQVRPDHAAYGLVADMRQAPPRNDPAFENAMARLRVFLGDRFARLAVLLDSPVGVLQVDRLGRAEGGKTFATRSEAAALRFARGQA